MSLFLSDDQIAEEQRLMIMDCTNKTKFLTGEKQRQEWIACVNKGDMAIANKAFDHCIRRVRIGQGGADCFFTNGPNPIPADSEYGYYPYKKY